MATRRHRFLSKLTPERERSLGDILRTETTGGILLAIGTAIALVWANSPASSSYFTVRDTVVGPDFLHLNLTLGQWATDGLLAIFFFVVGLELKQEFTEGDLRSPSTALIPIVAAVGGMIAPVLIYVAINAASTDGHLNGWAIPSATDIAFAIAVLSLVGSAIPSPLRSFLLTLAVVDDLLAVTIIAIFYGSGINFLYLILSLVFIGVFALVVRRKTTWWILIPLALLAWVFMHASGVHATIAGALLGFSVPAHSILGSPSTCSRLEHAWRPVSSGFAIPIFALFAAGVTFSSDLFSQAIRNPISLGVFFGMILGKPIGIMVSTFFTVRFTRSELDPSISWPDILGISFLGGIGFTVSLLIGELAFGNGSFADELVKTSILCGSLTSAIIGGLILVVRNRQHAKRAKARETLGESSN